MLPSSVRRLLPRTSGRTSSKDTMTVREASHAGSWYTSSEAKLSSDLDKWLANAHDGGQGSVPVPVPRLKAIIGPHAGYSYSGPAAAWAYATIDPGQYKTIFVLGPSHHVYLDGCALSKCESYETPVGSLPLDLETTRELKETNKFETMSVSTDEDEHSIEMHLPYIRHVFRNHDIKIVPVLVGAIKPHKELEFGRLLAPYLADSETLFVISSDFCHWGTRFQYTYYRDPSETSAAAALNLTARSGPPTPPIHASIRALDHRGMDAIAIPTPANSTSAKTAAEAHSAFASYLSETKNTVCGRHPIGVLLGAVVALQEQAQSRSPKSPSLSTAASSVVTPGIATVGAAAVAAQSSESGGNAEAGWDDVELKFVRYEQSSQCVKPTDSSVSYASAYLRLVS